MTTTDTQALSCQELVELVTDYLEGALEPADQQRFEAHISLCHGCTRYLDQLRETIRLTGTITTDDLTAEAEHALLAAFSDWASSEGRSGRPE
jgi:anti-sigma factor RsiW